ncbi:hypothetical protein DRP05_12735 [Archaeoglobales archaeon]|nr:MAG: hypothetical protein DRP05_12735 [Archaeoglobales archaeon]
MKVVPKSPTKIRGKFEICPNLKIDSVIELENMRIVKNGEKIEARLEIRLPPEIKKLCHKKVELLLEDEFNLKLSALALVGVGLVGELVSYGSCIKIKVKKPISISEEHLFEAEKWLNILKEIPPEEREWIMRVLKWWRRGFVEEDKIDKFIDFYIAFEMIGKKVAEEVAEEEAKDDKEKKKMKNAWINTFCKKYELDKKQFEYNGYRVNQIRAALLHAKHELLDKEEAEELAEKYADEFGMEVLKSVRKYLMQYLMF